jgi:hypothetical protein
MVSKICPWDGGVCRLASCDIILPSGEVTVCKYHGNESGRLTLHRVGFQLHGIFDKKVLKRWGGC